jgi:hypothetical protein
MPPLASTLLFMKLIEEFVNNICALNALIAPPIPSSPIPNALLFVNFINDATISRTDPCNPLRYIAPPLLRPVLSVKFVVEFVKINDEFVTTIPPPNAPVLFVMYTFDLNIITLELFAAIAPPSPAIEPLSSNVRFLIKFIVEFVILRFALLLNEIPPPATSTEPPSLAILLMKFIDEFVKLMFDANADIAPPFIFTLLANITVDAKKFTVDALAFHVLLET